MTIRAPKIERGSNRGPRVRVRHMHRPTRISPVCIAGLVLMLVSACKSENPERQQAYVRPEGPAVQTVSIRFDADDRRDRAELRPEETLVVRLESRGGMGNLWQLTPDAARQDVLEVVGEPRVAPPVAGAAPPQEPKWDVFTLRALRPGTATLKFNHVRLTDPATPANRHAEVRVEVKPR
jgi:hypothetical protein